MVNHKIMVAIFVILSVVFVSFVVLFLSESREQVKLEVEYCNGGKDTILFKGKPYISTSKEAVPVIYGEPKIVNVCKFKILK